MKRTVSILSFVLVIFASAGPLLADEAVKKAADGSVWFFGLTVLAAGIAIGLGTVGTGIGQGITVGKALEAMARQPEEATKIQINMFIGLAIIEALCIYSLLVVFILLFSNPFKDLFLN